MGQRYPHLSFDIGIVSASQMVEALRRGDADIGLSFFMPRHDDIVPFASAELRHHAVMAPGHPLTAASEVSLHSLAAHRLILPDESYGVRQALERAAHQDGIVLAPTFRTASLETQKALALNGAGVLVLPPMAVARECQLGQLVSMPLASSELEAARVDLCVYRHRQRSFATEACLSLLANALQTLQSPSS